ncbi:small integral membrane protein 20 isoform X1 [Oenanthe melanoleuca]|uniref:small integral membrane protein 20 isoform X1 n=1 Tax=Oenanthe melanoleuca TaxID=2939378 RepID=UPI0024C123A7|nr:small integral membrane protein 20 isoform X1 [Oenanthe melanoleuca]
MKINVVNQPRQLKISGKEKEKRVTDLLILLERVWPSIKAQVKFNLQASFYSRERTSNEPSWYCSRGYSACRVKSVVGSIWKKVIGDWCIAKLKMDVFSCFFFH